MVLQRTNEPVALPSVEETPVYTAAGDYFGDAVDVALDLEAGRAEALLVGNVDTRRFGELPDGAEGVRIPYRYVRSIADVVVLNHPLDPDALTDFHGPTDGDDRTGRDDSIDAVDTID